MSRPEGPIRRIGRKNPEEWKSYLRQQRDQHDRVNDEALALWARLDDPVYDSPAIPESGFPTSAVEIAKRGRRCAEETAVCGSNKTRKAIRDHERSAAKHGDEEAEADRLTEYPIREEEIREDSTLHPK